MMGDVYDVCVYYIVRDVCAMCVMCVVCVVCVRCM